MKIICLVKFTPDVDAFEYDYENNVLIRDNVKQIINPDDACALGFAIRLKKKHPELEIEVATMGPLSVKKNMEDILRRRIEKATLLSDSQFSGSDTLATSLILGTYLKQAEYDVILTGSQTLDGDTAHVPAQLAEYLGISHMSGITRIDEDTFLQGIPHVEVDTEKYIDTYAIPFPAILSIRKESKYKLPFVRYDDLELDVSDKLQIITNKELNTSAASIGIKGSATKVVKTYMQAYESKEKVVVQNDEEGIEFVYNFLKEKGYLQMKKCLIFLEKEQENFCVDLLKTAEEMYGMDFESYALSFHANEETVQNKFNEIIRVSDERIRDFDVHAMVGVMEELHELYKFDSILITATHFGRMLAPALAMRLQTGLVADVTQIGHYQDKIEMVRPAFSGKILAGIINTRDNLVMMSVRPGVFLYDGGNCTTKFTEYVPKQIDCAKIEQVSRRVKPVSKDIRESDVLVSGGGGILRDFDVIDSLAERLGGMKAASRRVVDSGKADRSIQVGQSGKIVHPKLYIALGIYGALQHVAGLNRVEHIIAVNTNKSAPMCSLADIVVEGDAKTFVDKLVKRIDCEK